MRNKEITVKSIIPKVRQCVYKSARIHSFSDPYFPAFGRSEFSLDAGKYGEKNAKYGHFLQRDRQMVNPAAPGVH